MGKQYQTRDDEASTLGLTIPEEVSVALAEIAESAKEGLLALAVGAGLQVLGTLMEESVTQLAGPKGKHNPDRAAVRHGHEHGSVTLGGRRVGVQRPRVRAADGSSELPVAAYELFSGTEILGRLALERMLGGLSTRRYPVGLEPVGSGVAQAASGTSKSAVSRRFVAMTHTALAELWTSPLRQDTSDEGRMSRCPTSRKGPDGSSPRSSNAMRWSWFEPAAGRSPRSPVSWGSTTRPWGTGSSRTASIVARPRG